MACNCSRRMNTKLKCVECKKILIVRHDKSEPPLAAAANQNKACKRCGSVSFEVIN